MATEGLLTESLPSAVRPFRDQRPEAAPAVAVIVPAYNEETAIGAVLDEIPGAMVRYVLVVDNGSTDGTAEAARRHGAHVLAAPQRGYGAACWAGMQALPAGIDVVVFLDGDHSDYPEELADLVNPILDGAVDFVLGSRAAGQAERGALQPHQRFGNWLATRLIAWRTGVRFTDLGPFRAIRRASLDRLAMADRGFGWTVEMQLKAARDGLRIREIPVRYRKRIGVSKISGTIKGSFMAGWVILGTIWRFRRR